MHAEQTERNSWFLKIRIFLLNGISLIFKTISFFNLKLKARRAKSFPEAFIVSIDNLSFGGTGKTSLVIAIGRHLESLGFKFAVVTRGYRSKAESGPESIRIDDGHSVLDVGDEARLFLRKFPRQDIYVGRNRKDSIAKAIAGGNTFILLDDGFQSAHIKKNLSIMLFNTAHPYYYLRNFKGMMKQENVILYYGEAAASCPVELCGMYDFQFTGFFDFEGAPVEVAEKGLAGFSALGDNDRFQNDLTAVNLLGFKGFNDHYDFSMKDLEDLDKWRIKLNADYLVCTEKDFIKIMRYKLSHIPFIYAENSIKFNIDLMSHIINHAKEENYI